MSYSYQSQKPELFKEENQAEFLKIRDKVRHHIQYSGAFRLDAIGGSWFDIACIDRLVEIGELVEMKRDCWGQFRVFTTPQVHNL